MTSALQVSQLILTLSEPQRRPAAPHRRLGATFGSPAAFATRAASWRSVQETGAAARRAVTVLAEATNGVCTRAVCMIAEAVSRSGQGRQEFNASGIGRAKLAQAILPFAIRPPHRPPVRQLHPASSFYILRLAPLTCPSTTDLPFSSACVSCLHSRQVPIAKNRS